MCIHEHLFHNKIMFCVTLWLPVAFTAFRKLSDLSECSSCVPYDQGCQICMIKESSQIELKVIKESIHKCSDFSILNVF